ncbi:MAG TPA: class II aldolase/adducin family protein [Candidatus Ornithospirochaeta stercorigallinarum]|nr:class II aldolase/adducin family protein [Candidatus Ornithospirochaeta stercorigallinarum]
MSEERKRAEKEIADTMRRVYERGLTTSLGGNISMRLGSVMLITPSSLDKASLGDEDIAKVNIESGRNLTPCLKLSIESEMHRLIYLKRPTCKAVIHAHPVFSSLFSASEEEIRTDIIAESYYQLGRVVKTPYAIMGSRELAEKVSDDASSCCAVLLERHGVLTVSDKSLLEALERLECLENAARMSLLSRDMKLNCLSENEKYELDLLRKK